MAKNIFYEHFEFQLNFQHCLICLKMEQNAAEQRYMEWLIIDLKKMELGVAKDEFQPNLQHCLVCLKMDQNPAEPRYAEWLVTVLKNNRGESGQR